MKKNLCFNIHFFNSVILFASLLLTGCYDDKGNYAIQNWHPWK